ncbi:MAG: hypothetical protein ACFB50_01285 [Rubrobacteraceae bacterium]
MKASLANTTKAVRTMVLCLVVTVTLLALATTSAPAGYNESPEYTPFVKTGVLAPDFGKSL